MIIRELWDAIGRRSVELLDNVTKDQREAVTAIAYVVTWAESDPRHQVVRLAADVGGERRDWRPSAFAFPDLGSFGDPLNDPEFARLWTAYNEQGQLEEWSAAAGAEPACTDADGRPTPLSLLRMTFLSLLPRGAARARARLRRRVGWGRGLDDAHGHRCRVGSDLSREPIAQRRFASIGAAGLPDSSL